MTGWTTHTAEGNQMRHWHEVEDWLRACAHDDVVVRGAIRPTLVAFAGARPLLIARWRPFAPREGHVALTELLSVTTPLGADRLAVAIGGTVRSLDGPSAQPPPVAGDGARDALVVATAERDVGEAPRCTLTPFERSTCGVQWGLPDVSDAVAGWLPHMLRAAVHAAVPTRPSADDVAARALRCLVLGHELRVPRDPRRSLRPEPDVSAT
jgi:hypothetical protein